MSNTVGLFFGSFNPIHIGHVILANYITEFTELEQVWLVITPHNPFKEKSSLMTDSQRLNMVNLALQDYPKLKASSVEFALPQPNYTVDTLAYLEEKYPEMQFTLIMGEDNIASFHKWKNYEIILEKNPIIVYPRLHKGKEPKIDESRYQKVEAPIIEISSTQIRQMIKEGKNYRPYLCEEVFEYIDGSHLYQ